MKKRKGIGISLLIAASLFAAGCTRMEDVSLNQKQVEENQYENTSLDEEVIQVIPSQEIIQLESGLSVVRYDGDYGYDAFLSQGGASSDHEVIAYLANNLLDGISVGSFLQNVFGCSTIAVTSPEGEALFGRNFDWNNCEAMIAVSYPDNGYASVSTVNMDFVNQGIGMALRLDKVKTLASLYAPLDGMNEAGLVVSVNMIQDSETIEQNTEKPDITTTTAIRLLLNKAANVEEALALLQQYDMHASMGMMIHFAIADAQGRSVVVEYIDNEMVVTQTPVVTNFYITEGEKYGIGTEQSHQRYEVLMESIRENKTMDILQVRDALDSVSKDNFHDEFASTEWSIVFNQSAGEVRYYHRENYEKTFVISLEQ